MLVGTGGTTGRPKGVMLTGRNIETMSALTLMSYPFGPRPRYLALAPLTHAAGVLCFPVMTLGGEIVIMPKPDLAEFLALIERAPDHSHVPAADADLHAARSPRPGRDRPDQPAVPVVRRGAHVRQPSRGGPDPDRPRHGPAVRPVRSADDDLHPGARPTTSGDDGSLAREHLSSAGRPTPLTTVAIMDDEGHLLGPGRARRDRGPRPAGHGRLLPEPGRPPRKPPGTDGITPGTSATSTRTTTCSSSTAPRT